MLTRIFLFIFLLTIQFSAFAYELLSCKTTVSPGCDGGVLEHITESHILSPNDYFTMLDSTTLTTGLVASTEAKAFSASGYVQKMITFESSHNFSIQNNTNATKHIKLNIKLSTHDGKFTNNEYTYQLKPHESMNDSATLYFIKQYLKPGKYEVYAHTTLSGCIYSSASDSNKVTIKQ